MSDTLEGFRNVESWIGGSSKPIVLKDDFTALLAFAGEQQQKLDAIPIIVKDRDDYRRKVEEQQKEIDKFGRGPHLLTARDGQQALCGGPGACKACDYDAKLSAMEEVVEAGRKLALDQLARGISEGMWRCDCCDALVSSVDSEGHGNFYDGSPCPVGIVLSFTKNREAGR